MKRVLLKAAAKKQKYLKRIEKIRKEEDSDGYLSSDDEEQVSDNMVSRVLENQYIIVKYLGRGSFSKTWMVYDFLEDRFLALKVFEERFEYEYNLELGNFKRFKGVTHPNIINFYGTIDTRFDGLIIRGLLLELLGDSIELLVDEQYDDKISSDIIRKVTRDILGGLDFLHSRGLVHNDMKFDNVLVSKPNYKILEYMDEIRELKINEYYLSQIEELSPKELQLIDKKKRKMLKRKIKERANKETVKKFRNDIIKINNSSLENLKLNIQEIPKEEIATEAASETTTNTASETTTNTASEAASETTTNTASETTTNKASEAAGEAASETTTNTASEAASEVAAEAANEAASEVAAEAANEVASQAEEPKDEFRKVEIDLEDISVKIIDLGNAELIGKMESDEILTRSYRPPENILNAYYDNKADIWVVGCLLYELFNGSPLFDLSDFKGKSVEKDRYHIALMYDVLGKMPKEIALECEYSEDFFDNKGRVLKNKGIQERNIREELCNRIKLDAEECEKVYNLIKQILDYNPRTRPSCKEILESQWYSKCD